jgi:hypothetical protein
LPATRAKKTGVAPGGSRITNNVTKACNPKVRADAARAVSMMNK